MTVPMREVRNDGLGRTRRLQVACAIGKAHDTVGVGDIYPLRIIAARKERNSKRAAQPARKNLVRDRLGRAVREAKDANTAGVCLGDEDVCIWRDPDDARSAQSFREQLDVEAD